MQDERSWRDTAMMYASLAGMATAMSTTPKGGFGTRAVPKKSKNRKARPDKKKKRKASEKARRKNR